MRRGGDGGTGDEEWRARLAQDAVDGVVMGPAGGGLMDVEVDGVGDGGREGGRAERGRRPLERVRATRSEHIFDTGLRTTGATRGTDD